MLLNNGLNRRHLAWALALVTVALWQSLQPATGARALRCAAALAEPDLRNETRVLETFVNELAAYRKQCALLGKKPSVARAEFDPLQRKSDELKGRLPSVQSALREIIKKLKAANEWNNLDADLLAKATDERTRTFFQQGSAKRDLEDAANNAGSQSNEISVPLNALRQKLAARAFSPSYGFSLVPATYHAPAPAVFATLNCYFCRAVIDLTRKAGGTVSDNQWDAVSCACGFTRGLGTMADCSELYPN